MSRLWGFIGKTRPAKYCYLSRSLNGLTMFHVISHGIKETDVKYMYGIKFHYLCDRSMTINIDHNQ